jgi:hypothetical protein
VSRLECRCFASQSPSAAFKPQVAVAEFGLYGDQSVFESEATRRCFASKSITAGANTKRRDDAHLKMTATTLQWVSKTMDATTMSSS